MTQAGIIQIALLTGVFVPLLSFAFLAFRGTRLGSGDATRRNAARRHASAADPHGHGLEASRSAPGPGEPLAGWVATGAIGISLLMSVIALMVWAGIPGDARQAASDAARDGAWLWASVGALPVHFAVKLDSLTIIMYLMVTLCAACIHVFSIGYMSGDARFARFFAFLSLFCFSMLGLVISANLLFMFIFWELVGVCSYFLIGFWFEKKSASNAAIKAFVVNRVGDFGFMIGLGLCVVYLNTLALDSAGAVFEAGARQLSLVSGPASAEAARVLSEDAHRAGALFTTSLFGVTLATWLGIGLFCGAIGKSAQFPLHVWLPDAMEGPTPVSALIHAATMVAAGVYLTARIFTLLTPGAQQFIMVIGCVTLAMAALMAIVQTDIKRVLAYSTLSQLGYMIFALGIGAWIAALFHLLTHAFFKALLFLGAGQVIAGTHHEQDMRRFGGLWSKMPRTAWTFLIAVLAISGAGLPWTPIGLGGFYSKDEILAVAGHRALPWVQTPHTEPPGHADAPGHAAAPAPGRVLSSALRVAEAAWTPPDAAPQSSPAGTAHPARSPAPESERGAAAHGGSSSTPGHDSSIPWGYFLVPLLVAYITPFYMGRCFVLTFMGRPRDRHVHDHAHESPLMYGPLLVLAFMTIVSGCLPLFRSFVAYAQPHASLVAPFDAHHLHGIHAVLPVMVGFAWIIGLGAAWLLYRDGLAAAERLARVPGIRQARGLLLNKFYFDEVYGAVLVGGAKAWAVVCRLFDAWIIDGIVHALAYLTERIARFSGIALDNGGVDGVVNGVGRLCWIVGGALRRAQTGVIRNYVLLAVLAAACVLIGLWSAPLAVGAAAVGVCVLARNVTLLIVLATATAIFAGWQRQPVAASLVLAATVIALIVLGHRRDAGDTRLDQGEAV